LVHTKEQHDADKRQHVADPSENKRSLLDRT
jgi:hypothetical protein